MRTNHCLFPVKLTALLNQAQKNDKWLGQQLRLEGMPQDGLTRIMLMTPEMHQAFDGEFPDQHTRFRLAIDPEANISGQFTKTVVEIYSGDEHLLKTYHMAELTHIGALAIQAELMYACIEQLGGYINSL